MIRLFAMDVDGTLTDGGVYISSEGSESKRFDIQDGMGITRFRRAGGKIALISGRYSAATERRAKELKIDIVVNGVGEKLPVLKKIAEELGLTPDEVAYAGDDVNDIDCAKWAGFGAAVANAVTELKTVADYVTQRRGGDGAVREITDILLIRNAKEKTL